MILVDIGNSGLKATRWDDRSLGAFLNVFRLSWSPVTGNQSKQRPEQLVAPNQRWCRFGDERGIDWIIEKVAPASGEPWLVSSVQGSVYELLERRVREKLPSSKLKLVTHHDVGMRLLVRNAEKLGIDRLLAAFAAWQFWLRDHADPTPMIVVQAGTAVTVDMVDATGTFAGGAILPGLGLSLQFLAAGTDRLPWLASHNAESTPVLPGRDTEEAIAAGVNAAFIGGVRYLIERYRKEINESSDAASIGLIPVIVSGGDAAGLIDFIEQPRIARDHLVLMGLRELAWKNSRVV